jgi:hypothetical protein
MKSASTIDEQIIPSKRNSTVSSSFSSTSSLIENENDDNVNDKNEDTELFPQLNSIKPRLEMQISHQVQY